MQKKSNLLWSCLAGIAVLVCFGGTGANAAGRSMVSGVSASTARMPTMPTMSINTVGTHAVAGVEIPSTSNNSTPEPQPEPQPQPQPQPVPTCDDGSVADSSFTVNDCMQSLLNCVQGGGLAHGVNDLFNRDLRNSIINGMGVCAADIDKCIREVRVDCHNVYDSSVDVWLDFNSRIVQPEYYNFVLRKTGLTPNQAENVCGLLDKNIYGKSFAAVSASGDVTGEYQQNINAYNNNSEIGKNYPMGPNENTTANGNIDGVDGERGHYARWDATNGVCKVRVAAYNKDNLITNNWLWGALGDDTAAEVWQDAGSTFTCNKELFDFSLLNNTKTTALVGMGGGTLLGAGIGYATGHKAGDFDCGQTSMRNQLFDELSNHRDKIRKYMGKNFPLSKTDFDKSMCEEVSDLYYRYVNLSDAIDAYCKGNQMYSSSTNVTCGWAELAPVTVNADGSRSADNNHKKRFEGNNCQSMVKLINGLSGKAPVAGQNDLSEVTVDGQNYIFVTADIDSAIALLNECKEKSCGNETMVECKFKSLKNQDRRKMYVDDYVCDGEYDGECVPVSESRQEVNELKGIYENLTDILGGKKVESTKLRNTLIGAGVGLGAGGVATAITAFVERNNITCRVGDGLNSVGFGKSFTIDSLKDFYVKWNLRVADSISPTARVTSCQDWINTCGMYTTKSDCENVTLNYQAPGRNTTNTVYAACKMSGSVCIENRSVAVSYGACENEQTNGNGGSGSTTNQQSVSLIAH